MLDVKKLIAGFLILASGASSSIFIFSYLNSSSANGSASAQLAANSNLSPGNAFAAQDDSQADLPPAITTDPNNVTGQLTTAVLTGIIDANPDGPQTDTDGSQAANPPDESQIMAELSDSSAVKNLQVPDWDAEATAQKLNLVSESDAAKNAYGEAFQNIYEKDIAQTDLKNVFSNTDNVDPDALAIATPAITDALAQAVNIPTPPSLVSFQKSFIKLLTYEQNALQTAQDASTDPVKAALILQAETSKQQTALNQFKDQVEKAPLAMNTIPNTDGESNGSLAFLDTLFGVPTAHAQWAVSDWLGDAGDWTEVGDTLWAYAQKLLLQMAINVLTNFVQNQVLKWVNGSGAPRFVTAWADTFVNAGLAAANAKLQTLSNNVCPAFGPLINIALKTKTPSTKGTQTCTLPLTSMQSFYNSFTGGGGTASLLNVLQPNNNFYSQLLSIQDQVAATNNTRQNATQAKTVAASGFNGDQVCADGSNPNGTSTACDDDSAPEPEDTCPAGYTLEIGTSGNAGGTQATGGMCMPNVVGNPPIPAPQTEKCDDGTLPTVKQNGGACDNGQEPTVTTPGQTTNQVFSKALGSNVDLAVNAKSLAGIVLAVTESLMSALVGQATKAINTGVNSIGTGGGGITSVQPIPTPSSTPVAVASTTCNPTMQNVSAGSVFSIGATGGAADQNGNYPTYTWTASGSTPASATGSLFQGTYSVPGTYNVNVVASTDNTSATCQVVVTAIKTSCSPSTQTISVGSQSSLTAQNGPKDPGGNSPTYSWTAPGSTPASGMGNSFSGTYSAAGTYNVSVTASTENSSSSCQVIVQ
jgi:hypothetical protein